MKARAILAAIAFTSIAQPPCAEVSLPGAPLEMKGDIAAQMVEGIGTYLDARHREIAATDSGLCSEAQGSPMREAVLDEAREKLRLLIGAGDTLAEPRIEIVSNSSPQAAIATGSGFAVYAIRWPVFRGIWGEGLLLEPKKPNGAAVVALPDCDWSPEQLCGLTEGVPRAAQFARRLAESGCRVVVPVLLDRREVDFGPPTLRATKQPRRQFVYLAAYEAGAHIIGYDVQTAFAAYNALSRDAKDRVGIMGYGEGGLVAAYAGALLARPTVVSGYFQPLKGLWSEPIYRNVWSHLHAAGDTARFQMGGGLILEASKYPDVHGPKPTNRNQGAAAPGDIVAPPPGVIKTMATCGKARLIEAPDGLPGQTETLQALLETVGVATLPPDGAPPVATGVLPDADARMKRRFDMLMEDTQYLMRESPSMRAKLWEKADASSIEAWKKSTDSLRKKLREEVIGDLPASGMPLNPRARKIYDEPQYTGYEVVLDVNESIFAYGILLVPKDLKEGEKRPVVVCQHGLEGRPQDVADIKVDSPYYHHFGATLAQQGFIVYAPQNPYIGEDDFRVLQRKANPMGLSLFSFIVRQHERTLDWLSTLSFVDDKRIAFYGLSYGGKTAMRVPALVEKYCLSICSADYNEWVWKNMSWRSPYSYLYTGEYEMPEWNLANTFNYAEMSWLICPRPFMVERGHDDGVAPDEWVAYEFARTKRIYNKLGIGDRTEIEFFNGPHTINGKGTFAFLQRHLNWPPK